MSNLDWAIGALKITLTVISKRHPRSTEELTKKANQVDGVNRAIAILGEYKHQDEREERKKMKEREKLLEKYEKIKL